jgi:hypothetical protein
MAHFALYRDGPAPASSRHTMPASAARGAPSARAQQARQAERAIDVHELLKSEALSRPTLNDGRPERNRPAAGDEMGVSDVYVMLDSFVKNETSNTAKGEMQFQFMVQGVTRDSDQTIGVRDIVDNVTEVEVSRFAFPALRENAYVTNATLGAGGLPVLVANPSAPAAGVMAQTPYSSHFTMEFREFGRQSISNRGNSQFHFEFLIETNTAGQQTATPAAGRSKASYIFTDPVKSIDGLTVVLRSPDVGLNLSPDVLYGAAARVSAGGFLELVSAGHGLAAGDVIFVTGFACSNAVINSWVNRAQGLIVGAGTTADTIALNPNVGVSTLGVPGATITSSTRVLVYIAKNRIRIPLRMRRVVARTTNYMHA